MQLAEDQALIEESVMTLFEQCHRPLSAWYQTRMQRGHAPVSRRNMGHLNSGPCHHVTTMFS